MVRVRRQAGNVAVMGAIMIFPITVVMGGCLDIVRATTVRAAMQQALDAAVLAASPADQQISPSEAVTSYFARNIVGVIGDVDDVDLQIDADINDSGKSVWAEASFVYETVFLPLIGMPEMTITVASGGQQTWQDVEISLVLDVSGSMRSNNKIGRLRTAAQEFIDIILTDDVRDVTSISVVPFGTNTNTGDAFRAFVDARDIDQNSDNNFGDGHFWTGCLNLRPSDHTIDGFGSGGVEPLPQFRDFDICPYEDNEAVFLSNDASDLKKMIRDIGPVSCRRCYNGGTGIDEGAAYGFKALSPDFRGNFSGTFGADRPMDYDAGAIKAIVIMTDGEMTKWYRPRSCWFLSWGCIEYPINSSQAEASLLAMCEAARDEGIMVFTVGFQIPAGSGADQLMANCAGNDTNYFLVEDNDLASAFAQIAGTIRTVRLVG